MANTAVSVPPSTVIAGRMPATLTPASRVVTGPRLRGTAPRARCPRAARAFRRVIEGSRAALIDGHSPRRIDAAHLPPPPGTRGLVALGGGQAFCFNAPPRPPPPARGQLGPGLGRQAGDRPRHRRQRHRLPPRRGRTPPLVPPPRLGGRRRAPPPPARVPPPAAPSRSGSRACSWRRTVGSGPCRCSVATRLPVTR